MVTQFMNNPKSNKLKKSLADYATRMKKEYNEFVNKLAGYPETIRPIRYSSRSISDNRRARSQKPQVILYINYDQLISNKYIITASL